MGKADKAKITRSRNGCLTCKRRRRKCDETKPHCLNCINSNRICEGYAIKFVFDVDSKRKQSCKGGLSSTAKMENVGIPLHKSVSEPVKPIPESLSPLLNSFPIEPANGDENGLDFKDDEQFEHAFLSGLDYILGNCDNELLNNLEFDVTPTPPKDETFFYSDNLENDKSTMRQLEKKEENFILKHFFEKVIFLLDAHPQNPWPQLMMKFGSMDLAKSCFLSLSSMHLYVNNGGDEFYKNGLLHINNTMEYLIKYVKTSGGNQSAKIPNENEDGLDIKKIISKIKSESNKKKKSTDFVVILLLLYVHLLFAILESGRSALARMFLKLAASIASEPMFNEKLQQIEQSQTFLCVISWFDTVSALVSPDCRIPYCDPKWFGESKENISTDKMNGCPVGMFRVLYDLSLYRKEIMLMFDEQQVFLQDIKLMHKKLMDLRDRLLHYRDHVLLELPHSSPFTFIDRLKCAQLWSLAGNLLTIQLEMHYFKNLRFWIEQNRSIILKSDSPDSIPLNQIYTDRATKMVTEFLFVYKTISPSSPIITQMVWPIFYVAVNSCTKENRLQSWAALETLYETVKMGTIKSLMDIVETVWTKGCSIESVLAGPGWLENGIDMLPC